MASRVPVPSYVVPTDRFPPRRHEFEQRFVESRQTTGRRGLPVGEFETRQISVPTRLPTRCERLVVAPAPVNGHGSNLVGVPGRCPGSNDVEIRRVICSTNAIESFFIEEGPLDCAQLFHQTVGEANYREFLLAVRLVPIPVLCVERIVSRNGCAQIRCTDLSKSANSSLASSSRDS